MPLLGCASGLPADGGALKADEVAGAGRGLALVVGQGEGGAPVAPELRADDGEEGRVLTDRQQAAVAERPAVWLEVVGEDVDLADVIHLCLR